MPYVLLHSDVGCVLYEIYAFELQLHRVLKKSFQSFGTVIVAVFRALLSWSKISPPFTKFEIT